MAKFYFDDPEGAGPDRETSHPEYVKHITEEFYYDCTDEFSPFGNDDGADLLFNLEDWYREKKGKGKIVKWLFETIDEGGFKYASRDAVKLIKDEELEWLEQEDPGYIQVMDQMIISAAFGQFKISGELDPELKKLGLLAIQRQQKLNKDSDDETGQLWLERLGIMEADLGKIPD